MLYSNEVPLHALLPTPASISLPGVTMHYPFKVTLLASLSFLVLSCLGCDKPAEITSYDVPVKNVEQRMLVATILRGENAWFIKAMGSTDTVAAAAGKLRGLIDALRFPEDKPNEITWTVPEGWTAKPGNQFRAATLVSPEGDPPLEVAISKLSYRGDQDEYLLININRWRGQIGLDPVEKVDSAAGVETIEVKGETVWMFDGTGKASGGGMMPPFARRGPSPPTPPAPPTRTEVSSNPKITFTVPEGWQEGKKGTMGSKSYTVGEGEDLATCKVSDFPSFGMMGDPLSNVNRWRGQMGLEPLDQPQLDQQAEKISISETGGILVTIDRPDGSERMLASMVQKGGRVWFFQMMGTPQALDAQRESFIQMLGSVIIAVPETAMEGE